MNAEDEYNEEKGDKKPGEFSLDTDSEEGDDVIGVNIDINQLDEKASAVNALGVICLNAPKLCQNRMKDILEALEKLHFYFHENIKFHVCLAYVQITTGLMRLNGVMNSDDKFEWVKGPASGSPLPHDVLAFLDRIVFPYFYSLFEKEDNKEVIERALENLREIAEDFGPGAYVNQMDNFVKYVNMFLDKKTYCQCGAMGDDEDHEDVDEANPEEDYGSEEEEGIDGIDHDELILGNVTDIVIAVARAMGNEFAPVFAKLAPHIVAYTDDQHPKYDKNVALGCIAEVFAAAPSVIPTYFNDYLQLLEKMATFNDSKVNRNVAYSIGVLA